MSRNDNDELIEREFEIRAQLEALYESYIELTFVNRDQVGSRIDKSNLAIDNNTTLRWRLYPTFTVSLY